MMSASTTGCKLFHSLPCPLPALALHWVLSCSSALKLSSFIGFGSLRRPEQPLVTTRLSTSRQTAKNLTLGVLLAQIINFHLQHGRVCCITHGLAIRLECQFRSFQHQQNISAQLVT